MDTKQPEALRLAAELRAGKWTPNILQNEAALRDRAADELERLHAENETLHAENDTLRTGYDAARLEIESLKAQLASIGAGGVEPLRKRECLHKISEPVPPVALDAARYRFLRDGEWRRTDLESVIRLQLNTLWDSKIDAARAAQKVK